MRRVMHDPPFLCVVIVLTSHSTGGVTVPIRVPTPTTTSTRSSIHFIDKKPKKSPLVGELIRPSSHGEDGGEEWIKRSVSPHRMAI